MFIRNKGSACVATAMLVLATLGLGACGSDDDEESSSSSSSSSQSSSSSSSQSSSSSSSTIENIPVITEAVGWVTRFVDPSTGKPAPITGGEGAPASNVYRVTNRQQLLDALANVNSPTYDKSDAEAQKAARNEPKIIYIAGMIRGDELSAENVKYDCNFQYLDSQCDGYADEAYYRQVPNKSEFFFDKYVKGFDKEYQAKLAAQAADGNAGAEAELALIKKQNGKRGQFANNQKAQIQFVIPANTTILGVGKDAKIVEGYFSINTMGGSGIKTPNSNIIIRNLEFQAPRDIAPAWDAGDGPDGNWNARYDALSINGGGNVWIDHCTFSDGDHPDVSQPVIFGKHVQRHDGLLDIEDGADYITLSQNIFKRHDKTNMIGSGDGHADKDGGKFHITFTGNLWEGSQERAPRVRYGQVHLYNNYYRADVNDPEYPMVSKALGGYHYFIGMGIDSSILSESNAFEYRGAERDASVIVANYKGYRFKDVGSWLNGMPLARETINGIAKAGYDETKATEETTAATAGRAVEEWATHTFTNDLGWTPPYTYTAGKSVEAVRQYVLDNAGSGKLDIQ